MPTALHKQLQAASPAYTAYFHRNTIPKNAPVWRKGWRGKPNVRAGELFCRMEGELRPICGAKIYEGSSFEMHLHNEHGLERLGFSETTWRDTIGASDLAWAIDFYNDLMKHEEYPGKWKRKEPSPDHTVEELAQHEQQVQNLKQQLREVQIQEADAQKDLRDIQLREVSMRSELKKAQIKKQGIKDRLAELCKEE